MEARPDFKTASAREGRTGRPPKDPSAARYYDGKLHALLVQKLQVIPNMVRGGRIDPKVLAQHTGNARFTVYRWMNEDKLSSRAANSLIRISKNPETGDSTITKEDLTPFLLG